MANSPTKSRKPSLEATLDESPNLEATLDESPHSQKKDERGSKLNLSSPTEVPAIIASVITDLMEILDWWKENKSILEKRYEENEHPGTQVSSSNNTQHKP
jgi:hypothetical protein